MESEPERLVTLRITYEEALVLSGWLEGLSLSSQRGGTSTVELGTAERIALGQLDTALEPVVDEVFNPDWRDVVARAGASLVARYSG